MNDYKLIKSKIKSRNSSGGGITKVITLSQDSGIIDYLEQLYKSCEDGTIFNTVVCDKYMDDEELVENNRTIESVTKVTNGDKITYRIAISSNLTVVSNLLSYDLLRIIEDAYIQENDQLLYLNDYTLHKNNNTEFLYLGGPNDNDTLYIAINDNIIIPELDENNKVVSFEASGESLDLNFVNISESDANKLIGAYVMSSSDK